MKWHYWGHIKSSYRVNIVSVKEIGTIILFKIVLYRLLERIVWLKNAVRAFALLSSHINLVLRFLILNSLHIKQGDD